MINADGSADGFQEVLRCGQRERHSGRMAELIASEMMGSDDDNEAANSSKSKKHCTKCKAKPRSATLANGNFFDHLPVEEFPDADDGDYQGTDSHSLMSSSDSGIEEITNEEVQ